MTPIARLRDTPQQRSYATFFVFGLLDIHCLLTFRTFPDLKVYRVSLLETFVPFDCYSAEVQKKIGSVVAPDEAVALCIVEPFHCALYVCHAFPLTVYFGAENDKSNGLGCFV
jgi:hypothetical protein